MPLNVLKEIGMNMLPAPWLSKKDKFSKQVIIREPVYGDTHPPLYRYSFGNVDALAHTHGERFKVGAKGVQVAVFNGYTQKWEFGISDGRSYDKVSIDKLDPEFQMHLLIMGVSRTTKLMGVP